LSNQLPTYENDSAQSLLRSALFVALCVATCLPLVVAHQLPPQPTFVNQWLAGLAWLIVVALMIAVGAENRARLAHRLNTARYWLAFWGVFCAVIVIDVATKKTPLFIAAPGIAATMLALLIAWAATGLSRATLRVCFVAICVALAIAASLNSAVAMLQLIAPQWHDDQWIAAVQGNRVYGNLRQPNLLALVSLFGLVAISAVFSKVRWIQAVLVPLLTLAILASGSRAGMIGLALLVCAAAARWLFHRYASNASAQRVFTVAAVAGAVSLALISVLIVVMVLYDTRIVSTQHRLLLWQNVLTLIANEPWFGVGFGQLNFAWTLTPFTERAPDVFDHAHNFALQWAVELGLPAAVLLIVLLAMTIYCGAMKTSAPWRWSVLAIVAVALLHSAVEFPHWYRWWSRAL
jgi:O-antigen ligase